MSNTEIKIWKPFKISYLFTCVQSKGDNQAKDLESGDVPLVSAGQTLNGVVKFIEKGDSRAEIFSRGYITADMFGKCFYQPDNFYAVSHGRVNILIPNFEEIDRKISMFLISIMEHEFALKYSYNRMLSLEKLNATEIELPVNDQKEPDWDYMQSFIQGLEKDVATQSQHIINIAKGDPKTIKNISGKVNAEDFSKWANCESKPKILLDFEKWKEFKIGELFDTFTGGDLIIGDVEEGNIPVITHSAENNSVSIFSNNIPNRKLFIYNKTISLADRGTFFATIQPEDFYIGTRVKALVSKNVTISLKTLMFIACIINNEKFRFNYGRNCTGGLDSLTIKLPVLYINGKICFDKTKKYSKYGYIPDWEFMEDYITSLPFSSKIS